MDLEELKNSIVTKIHRIQSDRKAALHQHPGHDEVFYCVNGSGFGVLENREEPLSPGKTFVVRAGTMHALRTEGELVVASFMVPTWKD